MGEDRDVCVISFQVTDRAPAKDLMEFIEKGYHFVLDSDVSSGENEKGEYIEEQKQGKKDGKGLLKWKDCSQYCGEWKEN